MFTMYTRDRLGTRAIAARSAPMPSAPAPPPVTTLNHRRGYLPRLLTVTGTTTERKAAIEALIHEIKITEAERPTMRTAS
jgi:hypothetical protein